MKLVDWRNDEQALRGWTQWAAVYGLEPVRWRPVAGVWWAVRAKDVSRTTNPVGIKKGVLATL